MNLATILADHALWLNDDGGAKADLSGANLIRADLRGANLRSANLRSANLRHTNLLCAGNMREIKTLQIDTWRVAYTSDTLQIGCQSHPIEKWRKWNTAAGRKWIDGMEDNALEWADRHLDLILQIIDASPGESQ